MKKLIRITTVPLSHDKLLGKQLTFMSQYFEVIAVSSDENYLKKVAEKYGVKYHCVEMTRTISPFNDLRSVWKMYCFLKKEKPEIVHSHTPKAGIVGMMAAYFAKVPVRMHTVAGLPLLEATGIKRKILNFVEKLTYRFATQVYPNSVGLMEIIKKEKFCAPEKLKIIGNGSSNGIDVEHFNPAQLSENQIQNLKATLHISDSDFVFIFVGRLVKDKGIQELVAAFCNLHQKHPQIKLLLVGPLEQELDPLNTETLDKIQHNRNIISVGYQDDVRPYFAISQCLVFPSYREGFPNVVLQAGAMQLPAIVTDINGCNEIIENYKNGLIVPPKNIEYLQKAMEKLLCDTNIYLTLQQNARKIVASQYSQQKIWDNLLSEYSI